MITCVWRTRTFLPLGDFMDHKLYNWVRRGRLPSHKAASLPPSTESDSMSLFVIFVPCFRIQVLARSRIKIIRFGGLSSYDLPPVNHRSPRWKTLRKNPPKVSPHTLDPLVTNNRQNKSLITFSIKRCNPVVDFVLLRLHNPSFLWANIYEVPF